LSRHDLISKSKLKNLSKSVTATLAETRATLLRKIVNWTQVQTTYMPHAIALRDAEAAKKAQQTFDPQGAITAEVMRRVEEWKDGSESDYGEEEYDEEGDMHDPDTSSAPLPENFTLYLPSDLPDYLRRKCNPSLLEKERVLRLAQIDGTLRELRRLLRIKAAVYLRSRHNVSGQREGTRLHTTLNHFVQRINATTRRYRSIRSKLLKLDGDGAWMTIYQPLNDDDVRAPQEDEDDIRLRTRPKKRRRTTRKSDDEQSSSSEDEELDFGDANDSKKRRKKVKEGKRRLSWIWLTGGMSTSDDVEESDAEATQELSEGKFPGVSPLRC
jgi:hypothetical protein